MPPHDDLAPTGISSISVELIEYTKAYFVYNKNPNKYSHFSLIYLSYQAGQSIVSMYFMSMYWKTISIEIHIRNIYGNESFIFIQEWNKMEYLGITITADSTGKDIVSIAKAFHDIVGLPITMRTLNSPGVRIEKGKVLDYHYSGPVLEKALKTNSTIRTIPKTGDYTGIPVVVSTIKNEDGYGIAAIGIVDVVGTIDLGAAFGDYPQIVNQVSEILRSRVSTP